MTIHLGKLKCFDASEYLDNDEAISVFLADAMETQNPGYIAHAIRLVAKAKGMTEIAEKCGISRKSLYRSIGENCNPTLEPLIPVLLALGVKVTPVLSHSS